MIVFKMKPIALKFCLYLLLFTVSVRCWGQFRSEYGKDTVLIKKDNKTIKGITVKHKKEGLWFSYDGDGRVTSKGNYVKDVQQGSWTYWIFQSATDTLVTTGSYFNGDEVGLWTKQINRLGKIVYKHTKEYFPNNKMKILFYQNGNIEREFYYTDKKPSDTWTEYFSDTGRKKSEFSHKNGEINGKATLWFTSGKVMAEAFFDDNKNESIKVWDEYGILQKDDGYNRLNFNFQWSDIYNTPIW